MDIIDLTMPLDEKTPTFPGDPALIIRRETVGKHGCGKTFLGLHTHVGTHIDVPSHMIADAKTLSDFPITKFVGEAIVVDVRGRRSIEPPFLGVNKGDIVFFLTAHSEKAYNTDYFTNNPVVTEKAAQSLANLGVSIVGLDSFTCDNEPYTVHKILLRNDILIVENLVNLQVLAGKRFQCTILPLKITAADGAPCRVIAKL